MATEALEPLLEKAAKPYFIYVSSDAAARPDCIYRHVRGDQYRMSKAAQDMLLACHCHNLSKSGCKVLAFNPGWCVVYLTGEGGPELRRKGGARELGVAARALLGIVLGKRDADSEKNGMVGVDGGMLHFKRHICRFVVGPDNRFFQT
ncbi:hypothetical protein AAE478_007517 [Parahypoxylon ruwenzoriense]